MTVRNYLFLQLFHVTISNLYFVENEIKYKVPFFTLTNIKIVILLAFSCSIGIFIVKILALL